MGSGSCLARKYFCRYEVSSDCTFCSNGEPLTVESLISKLNTESGYYRLKGDLYMRYIKTD